LLLTLTPALSQREREKNAVEGGGETTLLDSFRDALIKTYSSTHLFLAIPVKQAV